MVGGQRNGEAVWTVGIHRGRNDTNGSGPVEYAAIFPLMPFDRPTFLAGMRAVLPVLLGVAPFGLITGVEAVGAVIV